MIVIKWKGNVLNIDETVPLKMKWLVVPGHFDLVAFADLFRGV